MRLLPTQNSDSRLPLWGLVGAFTLLGCGGFHGGGAGRGSALGAGQSGTARVQLRELDQHPPITLVTRVGDPLPAIAFATAHDYGSVASVALSALLIARLRAHGIQDVVSIPSQQGIELSVLCGDRGAARRFIEQVSFALSTPVNEGDPALSLVEKHLTALRSRSFAGHGDAQVAACSGELGLSASAAVPDVHSAAGRAELDNYRRAAFATRASAFAALGAPEFVNAAARDLESVSAWPTGAAAADEWPTSDVVDADATDGARHLSVALRLADADAALASVAELSAERAALGSRLRAFLPGYAVARVTVQARPRGACLRVDVDLPTTDPGPTPKEAAQAVNLVSEEIHTALPRAEPPRTLDDNIIEPSDPRQAAARAAWRALAGREEPGPERRFVAVSVHPAERAAFGNFLSALSDVETRPSRAPLETRMRVEPGQGQLWLLLGSPCGTLGESNDDAGQSALAMTLAARGESGDVSIEPWLTTDAVGLLAHAARRGSESPTEQAERVARAVARSLTERTATGDALALAQGELLLAAGGAPRPGYARLLDALAPDHRAWLEPRGVWASLTQANRDSVLARARDLLHGPLRIAILANEDDAQGRAAAHSLEHWFAPWREDVRRCQASAERAPRSGEISLAVADDANTESAYVGLPFPSRLKFEREADAFVIRLNSADGVLATALAAEHINASARAQIIGGGRAAALIVEIHAAEDESRRATLEVRRTLDRELAAQWSNEQLSSAQRTSDQRALSASLDPRRRIVDLWRGGQIQPGLSRSGLRAFQTALSGAAQVVVYVTHRD